MGHGRVRIEGRCVTLYLVTLLLQIKDYGVGI